MTGEPFSAILTRKLRLKRGQTALAIGAPNYYIAALRDVLGEVAVDTNDSGASGGAAFDIVSLFAREQAEVISLAPAACAATHAGGALWIMWPKKSSGQSTDLTRDTLWPLMEPLRWGPVASIAIDDIWSGLRFRPEADIRRQPRA